MSTNGSLTLEKLRSQIAEQEKCVDFFRERKLKRQRLSTIIKKFCNCSAFDFMHEHQEVENKNDSEDAICETETNSLNLQEKPVELENLVQVRREETDPEPVAEHLENSENNNEEYIVNKLLCSNNVNSTEENDDNSQVELIAEEAKQEQEQLEEKEQKEEEDDLELMELQELVQELINDGDKLQKMIANVNHYDEESLQKTNSEQFFTNKVLSANSTENQEVNEEEDFDAEITMDKLIDGHDASNDTISVNNDTINNSSSNNNAYSDNCTPESTEEIIDCNDICLDNVNSKTNDSKIMDNCKYKKEHAALMSALESFALTEETEMINVNTGISTPKWLDDEDIDDDDGANKIENANLKNDKGKDELTEDEVYEDDFENDENDDSCRDDDVNINHR